MEDQEDDEEDELSIVIEELTDDSTYGLTEELKGVASAATDTLLSSRTSP
jgi:hypothetical protein